MELLMLLVHSLFNVHLATRIVRTETLFPEKYRRTVEYFWIKDEIVFYHSVLKWPKCKNWDIDIILNIFFSTRLWSSAAASGFFSRCILSFIKLKSFHRWITSSHASVSPTKIFYMNIWFFFLIDWINDNDLSSSHNRNHLLYILTWHGPGLYCFFS